MDSSDLESGYRMRQGQPRLRTLLCGANGKTPTGDGTGQLQTRIRRNAAGAHAGRASQMAEATAHLCELNERFVPLERAGFVHSTGFLGHAASKLARISDSNEALRTTG